METASLRPITGRLRIHWHRVPNLVARSRIRILVHARDGVTAATVVTPDAELAAVESGNAPEAGIPRAIGTRDASENLVPHGFELWSLTGVRSRVQIPLARDKRSR